MKKKLISEGELSIKHHASFAGTFAFAVFYFLWIQQRQKSPQMIILQKLFFKIHPLLKILNPTPLATVDNLAVRQKLLADRHFSRTKRKEGQQPTAGLSNAGYLS